MTRRVKLLLLLIITCGVSTAQNQYVSTLNYRTMAVSPVAYVPGVNWVLEDNSAYDGNHRHFFFQGSTIQQPPWNLYTIDVTTGAVLSSPMAVSNNPQGTLFGLQYDNAVDTLYATYFDGAGHIYFSWVEIATGIVHPKQIIPGLTAYEGSTYDANDHWYIVYGGGQLVTLDARSGNAVYDAAFPGNIINLAYDNANSMLFGIYAPPNGLAWLDSISLPTANLHPVAPLTTHIFPQINGYTIDEASGNYLFAGTLPSYTECINYRLYTVNIAAAKIVDSSLYPYAADPTNPLDSNLLEFSFDNQRGRLYALNWRPTLQTIAPVFNVSAATNPICAGQAEVFNAVLAAPFTGYSYQWQVNGQPAGGSTPTYTESLPNDGDSIRCIVAAVSMCDAQLIDTSNYVVLTVHPIPASSVSISASGNQICSGDTVVFLADPVNGGSRPQYQWLIDGVAAGSNNAIFSSNALADGDTVRCIMTGSLTCSLPVASDSVVMSVQPTPTLVMPPDTVIARGQSVELIPEVGGAVTGYQWQPPAGLSGASVADPVAMPATTTTYALAVTSGDGCTAAGKVTIKVYTPLSMPNAFTPNGDGRNDVFRLPPSVSIQLMRFAVFDRWGQRVFMTTDPSEGWNGVVDGKTAPAGAYVWMVEYADPFSGKQLVQKGTVMLVR